MNTPSTRPKPFISDDNEPINHDRARCAQQTLDAFRSITGTKEEALHDLLCDLMHYCRFNEIDFFDEIEDAGSVFRKEVAEKD
jgi:hypothetical protein